MPETTNNERCVVCGEPAEYLCDFVRGRDRDVFLVGFDLDNRFRMFKLSLGDEVHPCDLAVCVTHAHAGRGIASGWLGIKLVTPEDATSWRQHAAKCLRAGRPELAGEVTSTAPQHNGAEVEP